MGSMRSHCIAICRFLMIFEKLVHLWNKRLPDNTVSSLAKLFCDIVALIDNEILVEDLEDLPALKICHLVAGLRSQRSTYLSKRFGQICACGLTMSWELSTRSSTLSEGLCDMRATVLMVRS